MNIAKSISLMVFIKRYAGQWSSRSNSTGAWLPTYSLSMSYTTRGLHLFARNSITCPAPGLMLYTQPYPPCEKQGGKVYRQGSIALRNLELVGIAFPFRR